MTVEVENSDGGLDAGFVGSVTISLANDPGGDALAGSVSVPPSASPPGSSPSRIVTEPTKFASRVPSEFSTSTVMPNGWPAATTDGGPEAIASHGARS